MRFGPFIIMWERKNKGKGRERIRSWRRKGRCVELFGLYVSGGERRNGCGRGG